MPEDISQQAPGDNTKFFDKVLTKTDGSKVGLIFFLHAFPSNFWIDMVIVLGIILITWMFFRGDFKLDNASAMAGYTAFLTGAFSIVGRGGSYKKTDASGEKKTGE